MLYCRGPTVQFCHMLVQAVDDTFLRTARSAMALLGRTSPSGLAGSNLQPRTQQDVSTLHKSSAAEQASRQAPSYNATTATVPDTCRIMAPLQPLKVADMERGSNGAEATPSNKVEPALVTLRTPVRPVCSGSTPRSCTQECALSSPRTPASCTANPPAMAEQSTSRQPARMTAEAMRAICARWSALEDFTYSQARGTAENARVSLAAASQSPGVLLDMTSSPGSARSEQHLAEHSPAPAQAAIKTPHKAHVPGSLGARLRAAAREAAAATIAEGGLFSMSKAPEDDQEQQHQGARGRSGVLGKRMRDGTAVVTTSREPEVGDLAAALELEEAPPGPTAPLRLRRVRAVPSSSLVTQTDILTAEV